MMNEIARSKCNNQLIYCIALHLFANRNCNHISEEATLTINFVYCKYDDVVRRNENFMTYRRYFCSQRRSRALFLYAANVFQKKKVEKHALCLIKKHPSESQVSVIYDFQPFQHANAVG